MKRVHAILHEPASYTVDRNHAVYDPLGITYSYMHGASEAKSLNNSSTPIINTTSLVGLIKDLREILSKNDIIIMNGYTGKVFLWLFILNFFYHRNIGLDSDTPLNIPKSRIKRCLKKWYLGIIFRNKHMFGLPGGSKSHMELFRYYGMPDKRIFLMPMMVDNIRFSTNKNSNSPKFRFLYVGRIIGVKNIQVLIDAFARQFNGNDNVELRIVGKGALLEQFKEKYSNIRNVIFAGPKYGDELIEEYHNSDVFVLPSSFEPWGLVVNEALAAGLPVIVSDQVGAAYDLVEKPDTGFMFRYDDAAELAGKMKEMVENKELYQSFSKNAIDLTTNNWNYDFYRKCLINFIENA